MEKNSVKINILIDAILFILFIPVALSSIILFYFLPSGMGAGISEVWGITRYSWARMHDYSGLIFIVLMIIHLILHWRWVQCIPKMLKSKSWRKK